VPHFAARTAPVARAAGKEERVPGTGALQREFWHAYERSLPSGLLPKDAAGRARQRAVQFRADAARVSAAGRMEAAGARRLDARWTELGPVGLLAPDYGPGLQAGRAMAFLLQKERGRMFLGSASGGLWKRSLAPKSRWQPKTDDAENLSIGCISADPNHPDVLYAGTGEPSVVENAFAGAGILKSTDGGEHWFRVDLRSDTGGFKYGTVTQVWVDPSNSSRVFASLLYDGLYESLDGGESWRRLLVGGGMGLEVSPADPRRMLFSDTTPYGSRRGDLRISADGGRTWAPVGGPWAASGRAVGRIDLAFAPSNPNVVWASAAPPFPAFGEGRTALYRSADGGRTWIAALVLKDEQHTSWYSNPIAVSPRDADRVFGGGINLWRFVPGRSLLEVSSWYEGDLPFVHADQHRIVFDPDDAQTLYACSDGGLSVSRDGGKSWRALNEGLGTAQFYAGAVGRTGGLATLLGGTQDNGTLRPTEGLVWTETAGGDGFQCAVDPQDRRVAYASYIGSSYSISRDGGYSFTGLPPLPLRDDEETPFVSPLAIDPSDGRRVFGGGQRVYLGVSNRQDSVDWRPLSADLLFDAAEGPGPLADRFLFDVNCIRRIAVAPSDGRVIYASGGAHLKRTVRAGDPWTSIDPPGGQYITGVALHPADPDYVVVSRSGYSGGQVMRSLDGGATWSDLSADLPNVPLNNVVLQSRAGRLDAYLAADTGVYYADLNAAALRWIPVGRGLPNVVVSDVLLADRGDQVIAVTQGRGMWVLKPGDLPAGGGDGLAGAYFRTADLSGDGVTRIDPEVSFDWAAGAPAAEFPADGFSVRWTGQVRARHSETHTFYVQADDGVRLWIDGRLLIDWWQEQPAAEYAAALPLVGGRRYDVRLEYADVSGSATVRLLWSSASTPREVIPQRALYSEALPLEDPAGLAAVPVGPTRVELTWEDRSDTETGFSIERRAGDAAFAELASVPPDSTAYVDASALPGTLYVYRVRALSAAGSSDYSNEARARTPDDGLAAPSGLAGLPRSQSVIHLTWFDNSEGERGFEVERKPPGGKFRRVGRAAANARSFDDRGLAANTTYVYRVRAYAAERVSAYSPSVKVKTQRARRGS
jgi:photosystem II stability/assembly factor-like uncharacterized protein